MARLAARLTPAWRTQKAEREALEAALAFQPVVRMAAASNAELVRRFVVAARGDTDEARLRSDAALEPLAAGLVERAVEADVRLDPLPRRGGQRAGPPRPPLEQRVQRVGRPLERQRPFDRAVGAVDAVGAVASGCAELCSRRRRQAQNQRSGRHLLHVSFRTARGGKLVIGFGEQCYAVQILCPKCPVKRYTSKTSRRCAP